MNETIFLSWLEFEKVLRRIESLTPNPHIITFKRDYVAEQEREHYVSVRSHYRYKDYSILQAVVKCSQPQPRTRIIES